MEIIGYKSKFKAWKLWIVHYVLYDNLQYYSWEYDITILWIRNGKFKIYSEIQNDVIQYVDRFKIKNIDMTKYQDLSLDDYNCMEIILYILKKEKMELESKNTLSYKIGRITKTFIFWFFYTIILLWLWFMLWTIFSINNLTVSVEEYSEDPQSINLFNKKQ